MPTSSSALGYILYTLQKIVLKPNLPSTTQIVYTTDLSIREGKIRLRATKTLMDLIKLSDPLLLYNRTPFIRTPEISGVVPHQSGYKVNSQTHTFMNYQVAYGSITLNFLYVSDNLKGLEEFETIYVTGAKFYDPSLRQFDVDYGGELGEQKYKIIFNDLQDLNLLTDEFALKSLSFTATISGWLFYGTFEASVIREIDIFYKDMLTGKLLETDIVK